MGGAHYAVIWAHSGNGTTESVPIAFTTLPMTMTLGLLISMAAAASQTCTTVERSTRWVGRLPSWTIATGYEAGNPCW